MHLMLSLYQYTLGGIIMKKVISITLALVMLVASMAFFTGCGEKANTITIAVPNDTTNEARALLLLEELGYITLAEGAGITATIRDIAENPSRNLPYKLRSKLCTTPYL